MSEFGGVTLETLTLLSATDFSGTKANDTSVNATRNAILLLDVDLGQVEVLLIECKVVFNVSLA